MGNKAAGTQGGSTKGSGEKTVAARRQALQTQRRKLERSGGEMGVEKPGTTDCKKKQKGGQAAQEGKPPNSPGGNGVD